MHYDREPFAPFPTQTALDTSSQERTCLKDCAGLLPNRGCLHSDRSAKKLQVRKEQPIVPSSAWIYLVRGGPRSAPRQPSSWRRCVDESQNTEVWDSTRLYSGPAEKRLT